MISGATIVCKDMCVHLSGCLYARHVWRVQVSGHYFIGSVTLLLILGCYSFVGIFFGGVINKSVQLK